MNKIELSILDIRSRLNKNKLMIGAGESKAHALKKAEIFWELRKRGLTAYSEAVFQHGAGRADIYCPELNKAFEVIDTEDIFKETKTNRYPCNITWIKSNQELKENDFYE